MGINEYIQIGEKIKQARVAAKISQKSMANKLGLSVSTYSNYENGYREPPLEAIKQICDILGTDLSYLILGSGKINSEEHDRNGETRQIAEEILANPEMKTLFNVVRDITPEELKEIQKYIEFIKSKRSN